VNRPATPDRVTAWAKRRRDELTAEYGEHRGSAAAFRPMFGLMALDVFIALRIPKLLDRITRS
jgi:hypothetical protein